MRFMLAIALVAGCAAAPAAPRREPLSGDEGELVLVLEPLQSPQLVFEIESVWAVRRDGIRVPLQVELPDVSALRSARMLASGRLAAGAYDGLSIGVRRARAKADLLLPAEPIAVRAPFGIAPRRTTVLEARIDQPAGVTFAPKIALSTPARALVPSLGLVTDSAAHELFVFDKHARTLAAVLPTGRSPWGVALDVARSRAYVALAGEDQLAVFDIQSQAELSRIRLGAGDAPRDVVLTADGKLLVTANSGSNTVSLVDAASQLETARLQVGDEPDSLLLDRRGARVYVFNSRSNAISVIDLARRAVAGTVSSETPPLRGQIDRAGTRLYVASRNNAYLTVYSLPDLAPVSRVFVGLGTSALKVDSATDLLYVANADGRVALFDPFSQQPIDTVDLPSGATWMAIDAAENALFAVLPEKRQVCVVDLTTKAVIAEIDVGPEPREVTLAGERN